jgi:hypothetical protein
MTDAEAHWLRCRPWVEAALGYAGGTHVWTDVWAEIAAGECQFWPGERSAMVTHILDFPRSRGLHFWLCGGDLSELLDMLPQIEAWGHAQGCTKFTTAGRPGWQRVLKAHGYQPVWNVCAKDTP